MEKTKSSKEPDLDKVHALVKRIVDVFKALPEVDGTFMMLFNNQTDSHLIATEGITGGMALEIIHWVLTDLKIDSTPYMQAILLQLSGQDFEGKPLAGGVGKA